MVENSLGFLALGYGKSAACGYACAQDPFDSLRSLRVTGADAPHPSFVPNDTFPLGGEGKDGADTRALAARDCPQLSVASSILEKGKTTLLPFSPYSGELHAERVKAARVYKP